MNSCLPENGGVGPANSTGYQEGCLTVADLHPQHHGLIRQQATTDTNEHAYTCDRACVDDLDRDGVNCRECARKSWRIFSDQQSRHRHWRQPLFPNHPHGCWRCYRWSSLHWGLPASCVADLPVP